MPIYKIQVGAGAVSLECNHPVAAGVEASVFSALLNPTAVPAKIHYRILMQNDRLTLFRKNRLTHRNRQFARIIYALEWQIVNDLIEQNKTALKLHSAALTYRNNGFIFCGAPSTGKTSLAILLIQNGWQLLSDEFALLNADRQIIPFPRNLIIKPHLHDKVTIPAGLPVFRLYGDSGEKIETHYLSPLLFGSVKADASAPLKGIVFLEKKEQTGFDLQPIARYAGFRLLIQHLFNRNQIGQQWIDFLVDWLNSCPLYCLKISSPLELSPAEQQALVEQLIRIHQHA